MRILVRESAIHAVSEFPCSSEYDSIEVRKLFEPFQRPFGEGYFLDMTDTPPQATVEPAAKPRFRWQILLIIPLAIAAVLAVIGPRQYRQKQAMGHLKEIGAITRTQPMNMPFVGDLVGEEYSQELTEVYLRLTDVSAKDLKVLAGVSSLTKLELTGSTIAADGWQYLGTFNNLFTLHLAKTNLSDAELVHLRGMSDLSILSLDETTISDAGVANLSGLSGLERLYLDNTELSDEGIAHLATLTGLKELSLRGVQISDSGLAKLHSLTKLEILRLSDDVVTMDAIAELQKFAPRCHVLTPAGEPG